MKRYGLRLQENKGEKTMNDNDIIKALECCSKGEFRNCQECKYLYAEVEEKEGDCK